MSNTCKHCNRPIARSADTCGTCTPNKAVTIGTSAPHFVSVATGRWFELDTRNKSNPDLLTGFAGHKQHRFACVVDVPAADLLAWVNGEMDFLPTGV